MAKAGFKRKLTTILNANAKRYSQLMYDHEDPIPHNLMHYRIYKTDFAQQYWLTEFQWASRCDERIYLNNFTLEAATNK